jgi:hypothetical protein
VKQPVFSFEAELLTDASFEHIAGRLRDEGPSTFRSLGALSVWAHPASEGGNLVLRWRRVRTGAEESGALILAPDAKGTHLRLEGRMKGWGAFLLFGQLRWRTDRLLDRFVEEL